jgi:hypothetical protein
MGSPKNIFHEFGGLIWRTFEKFRHKRITRAAVVCGAASLFNAEALGIAQAVAAAVVPVAKGAACAAPKQAADHLLLHPKPIRYLRCGDFHFKYHLMNIEEMG